MTVRYLTVEEILHLHFKVIKDYGGSHGVRDEGRLASLEAAPKQETFGVEQYGTLYEKAAVYMRNVIGDHPFTDGNKRTGVTIAGVFLMRNGMQLTAPTEELEDFAVQVAVERLGVAEIAQWLEKHSTLPTQ
jgi:death-on-curing protein